MEVLDWGREALLLATEMDSSKTEETVEVTVYVRLGDQEEVGVSTDRSIEGRECGGKRSSSWDVLRGRGLWSSAGDSGSQGWSSAGRAGLDTWMKGHWLGSVR